MSSWLKVKIETDVRRVLRGYATKPGFKHTFKRKRIDGWSQGKILLSRYNRKLIRKEYKFRFEPLWKKPSEH